MYEYTVFKEFKNFFPCMYEYTVFKEFKNFLTFLEIVFLI